MSSTNLPTRGFLGHDGIIQYLGIKYATLKNAFSDAQIFDYHDLESLNATTYGYVKFSNLFQVHMEGFKQLKG